MGQEGWVRRDRARMERGGGGLQQHSQQEGQEKSRTQRQTIIYRKKTQNIKNQKTHPTQHHHNGVCSLLTNTSQNQETPDTSALLGLRFKDCSSVLKYS